MKKILGLIIILLFLCACEPSLKYTSTNSSKTLSPTTTPIFVYDQTYVLPENAIVLGKIKVGDTGFTTNCDFDHVLNIAKDKARGAGADAIQITKIKVPDGFWSICYRITANAIHFDTSNWPRMQKTEEDFRIYYDENANSLNPIEGIWNVSETGIWRSLQSDKTRSVDHSNLYRVAIVKDNNDSNYDFVAIVLESMYPIWESGLVKARFRKTAHKSIYEEKWYAGDFTESNANLVMDENSLMKDKHIRIFGTKEYNSERVFIKAYPPLADNLVGAQRAVSTGTGFTISPEGHIVTSYHVIQEKKIIKVYLSKESFVSARILHSDTVNDLAVLKIENSTPNFLQIAPIRTVKTGNRVFTIGFPVSSVLGRESKYSEGVISSISGIADSASFLQITVPVQPGNSGGALVNEKGEVVGIVTSTAAILPFIKESGTLPQNVNWAVKADYLRPLIELPKAEKKEFNREQLIEYVKKSTFFIETE